MLGKIKKPETPMSFERLEEKEAVKKAAMIEVNGYKFYTLLADRIKDDGAREVLKSLAKEEEKHLKVIEELFFPDAGFSDEIDEEELGIEDHIERSGEADIFTWRINVGGLIEALDDPKKALVLALDTERFSVKFFTGLSEKAETPEAKKLYRELAEEERYHVARIEGLLANYREG
ncbi:MAG: ferritin family protein [Thermodesulfobacteriota bacterium]